MMSWALDGDLVIAEVFVVENLTDDALALDGLVGDTLPSCHAPRLLR